VSHLLPILKNDRQIDPAQLPKPIMHLDEGLEEQYGADPWFSNWSGQFLDG
jgi:hypothetical protein